MSLQSPTSLVLAALLLVGCDTSEPANASTGEPRHKQTIRIGTWNIEHFGQRDKFQDRPDSPPNRTPEQIEGVAEFLAGMDVDVLALQEIGGPEPLQNLLEHLDADYRFCLGTTGLYGETRISVGFLWNSSRVELVQCEEMADFPRKVGDLSVFHRKPVNAVFRVIAGGAKGMDFRAITVHLKASRGTKNENKRKAEVTVLRDYITRLLASAGEDQDIVVLGDFNHTYGAPAHEVFAADGFVEYATGFSSDAPSPTIVWFDEPIDHIALTDGIRMDLIEGSYRRHNQQGEYTPEAKDQITEIEKAWRVNYSDHYPVTVDLDATVDRDPRATFQPPKKTLPILSAK